jgi:DNA-binding transcriptional MerR regulator
MSRAARMFGEPPGESAGATAGDEAFLPTDVPLTVAAVAARLGVAPSTLRTWDRRYGLGPSGRAAGSHRRYTPEDVARLERMRRLTLAGAAPSDAARLAAPGARPTAAGAAPEVPAAVYVDDLSLAAAAVEGADARLRAMLGSAVRSRGLLRTWLDVARPAFGYLAQWEPGDRPGRDRETLLAAAVLGTARTVADGSPALAEDAAPPRVALLADPVFSERVGAHVLAAVLAESGVAARVVGRPVDLTALLKLLEGAPAAAIGIIGRPPGAEQLAREASERGGAAVFLIGPESPEIWLPGVVRVRTLPGAVHEIVGLLAPGRGAEAVSRGAEGPA